MDTRSRHKRSQIMAAVRSKDTTPELTVRRFLWSRGIRYRVHVGSVPGTPDIAIHRYKLAIFVHGCFWHGHKACSRGRLPKSRLEYWRPKIDANRTRDLAIAEELEREGWRQLVIWECQLRTQKAASKALPQLLDDIRLMCPEIRLS